jgi:hypothetical protein
MAAAYRRHFDYLSLDQLKAGIFREDARLAHALKLGHAKVISADFGKRHKLIFLFASDSPFGTRLFDDLVRELTMTGA